MTKITVLMDNSPGIPGTEAEHGLSLFIEGREGSLIFDTGETGAFLRNALVLGAELKKAGSAVISHAHYDHAGGVRSLIESVGFTGSLWTGPGFFWKKWKDDRKPARYLGIDFDREYLQSRGVQHKSAGASESGTEKFEIMPGIFAVNGFPRIHPGEFPDPLFTVDRENGRVSDDFSDEICLVIEQTEGIAVVLGCAHPGIMNMLDSCRAVFGKPLKAVIGGSHLVDADSERLKETIEYLNRSGCKMAALGHCSGREGLTLMQERLSAFRPLAVGERIWLSED